MAEISSIVYQPVHEKYGKRIGAFQREPVQAATLVADHGIDGDAKAGHHPDRQLNLLSSAWLDEVADRGFKTEPGSFGEQLSLRGLRVEALAPGTRLLLGGQAVIEITGRRTGCVRLEAAQGRSIQEIEGGIGALARVVVGGEIRVGDRVEVMSGL